MRSVIAAAKIGTFLFTSLFTMLIQGTLLAFTRGPLVLVYPRYYYAFLCRLFGLRVMVEGEIAHGRNIVYAGNHLSYLDIVALGSVFNASFIAKKDIASWPFFGLMARCQRTLFISRDPRDAASETAMVMNRLDEGLPLIAFPEGTSTNGLSVHPFKSSFFHIFLNRDLKIQPFTVTLRSIDEKPVSLPLRDQYAWYGDMTLLPHLWAFARSKGADIKVTLHNPVLTHEFSDRKQLSQAVYGEVSKGLDLLAVAA